MNLTLPNPTTPLATGDVAPMPPPAPRGAEWLDVATAAGRMGVSERHVRRECDRRWRTTGHARQERPAGGGKPRWVVRDDADPALCRVTFPDQLPCDLRPLSAGHRDKAVERRRVLTEWDAAIAAAARAGRTIQQATATYLADLARRAAAGVGDVAEVVSDRTLRNWRERFRAKGLAGLVDGRGERAAAVAADADADPFLLEVREQWLHANRPKVAAVHARVCRLADARGWEVRSVHQCRRYLARVPDDVRVLRREGPTAYNDKCAAFIRRDYSTLESNELWNADHHQFDAWVKVGESTDAASGAVNYVHRRPWVTAFQDNRSRKVVGWVVFAHDPNTDTILQALRRAVTDHGAPASAHVDNGKDFDSYALHGRTKRERRRRVRVTVDAARVAGVFTMLGIDARNVQPYHGQSKPIERFFGTLEDQFGRTWPTYCGSSPATRPERLAGALERGEAPTLAEFADAFGRWVADAYNATAHAGDGMDGRSPDAVFAANLRRKRTAAADVIEALLIPRTKPVKVGRNGVRYRGVEYGANEPALFPFKGKRVVLGVDERDAASVGVWTEDGRFVCTARANGRLAANATQQDLRAAIAEQRRGRKLAKEYARSGPRMALDLTELTTLAAADRARAARAERGPTPPTPPPSILPIRHAAAEAQAAAAAAARQAPPRQRVAVGAEGFDVDAFVRSMADAPAATSRPSYAPSFSQLVGARAMDAAGYGGGGGGGGDDDDDDTTGTDAGTLTTGAHEP